MEVAPSVGDFCKLFNPAYQERICKDSDFCLCANYPSLAFIKTFYGDIDGVDDSAPVSWLVQQIEDLCEYAGVRNKLTDRQKIGCARIISQEYYYLKISEVMLYFYRLKGGLYGNFYGVVDPMMIVSKMKDFVAWRGQRLTELIKRHEEYQAELARKEFLAEQKDGKISEAELHLIKRFKLEVNYGMPKTKTEPLSGRKPSKEEIEQFIRVSKEYDRNKTKTDYA